MSKKIWFGIPGVKMLFAPAPSLESNVGSYGYAEKINFENGGADVRRSKQTHKVYNFQVSAPFSEANGLNEYARFSSGYYGEGLVYFADPYAEGLNLFAPAWATPGLVEQSWKNISHIVPTFVDAASSAYELPTRSAVFDVESSSTVSKYATIVIPPDKTLYLGATGSATGGAGVSVVPVNSDGSEASTVSLALLSEAGATRVNTTFDGSQFQAVKVFLPTTGTASSVLTLNSMVAQLHKTNSNPVLPSDHVPGEGHTGLEFSSPVVVDSYVYIDPPRKATAFELVEVGAWR